MNEEDCQKYVKYLKKNITNTLKEDPCTTVEEMWDLYSGYPELQENNIFKLTFVEIFNCIKLQLIDETREQQNGIRQTKEQVKSSDSSDVTNIYSHLMKHVKHVLIDNMQSVLSLHNTNDSSQVETVDDYKKLVKQQILDVARTNRMEIDKDILENQIDILFDVTMFDFAVEEKKKEQ